MTKVIICFTKKGAALIKKINDRLISAGIEPCRGYICMSTDKSSGEPEAAGDEDAGHEYGESPDGDRGKLIRAGMDDVVRKAFADRSAIIFIGAAGIAVRAIAPYVSDKFTDSPVIVIDDMGTFVIPILSGHAGGANKIAVMLADATDAVPVITTASDVSGSFSPDVFAAEGRLAVRTRSGIKKVSAKALEGKSITLSVKDYPPTEEVDIIIADETDRECSLLLSPRRYVAGVGMKKGYDPEKAREFILSVLDENGIDINDVYAIATVDIKENEEALRAFSERYRIPVITFEASVLARVKGDFTGSEFVKKTVGVDNVCERAACLAAGPSAVMVQKKISGDGITVAIARRTELTGSLRI